MFLSLLFFVSFCLWLPRSHNLVPVAAIDSSCAAADSDARGREWAGPGGEHEDSTGHTGSTVYGGQSPGPGEAETFGEGAQAAPRRRLVVYDE